MNSGSCMIFFRSGSHDLNTAERLLADAGLSVSHSGDRLAVQWHNGPELRIVMASGELVQEEAAEIAEGSPFVEAMRQCDARFEISFDSLEEVLDEINTLIQTQLTLQNATRGYLFLNWNGNLSGPTA